MKALIGSVSLNVSYFLACLQKWVAGKNPLIGCSHWRVGTPIYGFKGTRSEAFFNALAAGPPSNSLAAGARSGER
jgi:hypothetical protein